MGEKIRCSQCGRFIKESDIFKVEGTESMWSDMSFDYQDEITCKNCDYED